MSFSPVCVHFCMCDSHTVTPAIINQTTPIRFHLMFRAFLFIYMKTQDIFTQCHRLPICFLTSDLTNSTRLTIRNKNQRTLIVRRSGLSRHFDGWKCCVWNYANLWQNTKKFTLFDFCLANLFGIFVGIGKWILLVFCIKKFDQVVQAWTNMFVNSVFVESTRKWHQ